MVAQQNQIPTGEGLILEKLWAYLDASREQAEQRRKEHDGLASGGTCSTRAHAIAGCLFCTGNGTCLENGTGLS